jgi:hypothetical protein
MACCFRGICVIRAIGHEQTLSNLDARSAMTTARATLLASVLLVLDGCAAALSSGGAPDPRRVQPERPSVATHAGTVAPGYVEIETGVETDRNADGTHALQVPTLVKVGIAPQVQLSVLAPVLRTTDLPLGIGDVGVGVKWRLTEGGGPLARVAILPTMTWGTGGDRGTGTTAVGLLLIDSRTIGPVSIDLNAGLTRRSGDGSAAPRTATAWTVASGIPVAGAVGWQLECFGYPGTHGPAGARPIVAILTGPTLGVWRSLAFDTGVILPLAGPQPKAWYAGMVTNLGSLMPTAKH